MQKIQIFCERRHIIEASKSFNWIQIMRIGTLILTGLLVTLNLLIASPGKGQGIENKIISLNIKGASLITVFKSIEEEADVVIMYELTTRLENERIDINVKDKTVSSVLDELTKQRHLQWTVQKNKFRILDASENTAITGVDFKSTPISPSLTAPPITGIVRGPDGQPIAGANVVIKGTRKGTTTNSDGSFNIEANNNDVVVISSIGFADRKIKINNNKIGDVILVLSESKLDEIQVIAYGTTTRRSTTGNVTTVKAAEIEKQPVNNPLLALSGRVAGLQITQQTGVPGGNISVKIRGTNSLTPNDNPVLYIIDGVPYSNSQMSVLGISITGNGNPLSVLNPNDIASVEVLKDADATAIYGSRGANGVILITTKKGKIGQSKLDVNVTMGMSKVSDLPKTLNTKEYVEMRKEAFKNDSITPTLSNAYDLLAWDTTKYTNWLKKMTGGRANFSNYQASYNGGNLNSSYLISANYRKERTVFPGDGADRKGGLMMNVNTASKNGNLKFSMSNSLSKELNELPQQDYTSYALALAPNAPDLLDSSGNLVFANYVKSNPYRMLFQKYEAATTNIRNTTSFSYLLFNGFEMKVSGGYNELNFEEHLTYPQKSFPASFNQLGSAEFAQNHNRSWVVEPQIQYLKKINEHRIALLAGSTFGEDETKGNRLSASGYTVDALIDDIKSAGKVNAVSSIYSKYRYNSFFAKLSYSMQQRFFLNLVGRRDGSSKFGPGKRIGNFGSIGASYIFIQKNEKGDNLLSYGKIRGSIGLTGSDMIPNYGYLQLWVPAQYPWNNSLAIIPNNISNANFAWEKNRKTEIGLDLGFLEDKILLSASYYANNSGNQLVGYALPPSVGFSSIQANLPAEVVNRGLEIQVNSQNISSRTFSWSTSFNVSFPKNMLKSFPGIENTSYASQYQVGKSLNVRQLFHYLGVNPQTGLYTFEDADKNGVIDFSDVKYFKEIGQKYFGGIENTFTLKNWELSVFFQFVKQTGQDFTNSIGLPGKLNNQLEPVLDRWRMVNDKADFQRYSTGSGLGRAASTSYFYSRFSDLTITDASYVRLKNLSISYTLPRNIFNKELIQNLKISLQCQNLLTFTKYKFFDPETQNYNVAPLRSIVLGLQLSL
jgi:TonB-dependent starch-binding outer membrane protein SusC